MAFNGRSDDTVQIGCRIVLYLLLMHGMTHDVAHMLPGMRSHIQQIFFLNPFYQIDKVASFQLCDQQVSNYWEDLIVHAGKQTGSMVF